ncbi:MAG: helix-turn-helix domain-containing protein [Bacteroidales bacterium]|jgi:excisionase family DNA binding protein
MNNPFEEINTRLSNIESLLLDIKHKPIDGPSRPDPEEFLTVQETAKFLKLSVPTVYTMIHEKRIPFMKRSKRCYFSKADLVNYLKEGRKKSAGEISAAADDYINKKKG